MGVKWPCKERHDDTLAQVGCEASYFIHEETGTVPEDGTLLKKGVGDYRA